MRDTHTILTTHPEHVSKKLVELSSESKEDGEIESKCLEEFEPIEPELGEEQEEMPFAAKEMPISKHYLPGFTVCSDNIGKKVVANNYTETAIH